MTKKKKIRYILIIGNKVERGEKEAEIGTLDELEEVRKQW